VPVAQNWTSSGALSRPIQDSETRRKADLLTIVERRVKARHLDCPYIFHRNGKHMGEFRKVWRRNEAQYIRGRQPNRSSPECEACSGTER
jgi:hypothetical protein